MFKTSESDNEFRFGDNGPKYLVRGPWCDIGVVVLKPGQEFRNHRHISASEAFLTLEGEVHLYLDGELHRLGAGDLLRCDPNEAHYVVNHGDKDWKAVFIKAPHVAGDSHPAEPERFEK